MAKLVQKTAFVIPPWGSRSTAEEALAFQHRVQGCGDYLHFYTDGSGIHENIELESRKACLAPASPFTPANYMASSWPSK